MSDKYLFTIPPGPGILSDRQEAAQAALDHAYDLISALNHLHDAGGWEFLEDVYGPRITLRAILKMVIKDLEGELK